MRLVLDTNVVVSALLWNGPPRRLLDAGRRGDVTLFTSTPLLAELTDILCRSKFNGKIAASRLSAEQLVGLYAEVATVTRPIAIPRVAPDPDDDVVIATALAAQAEFAVTGDRTLLAVVGYENTKLISVSQALQVVDSDARRR